MCVNIGMHTYTKGSFKKFMESVCLEEKLSMAFRFCHTKRTWKLPCSWTPEVALFSCLREWTSESLYECWCFN